MKQLPTALAASLASGATTLCRCWIVERRDGVRLGFTDHDETVTVDGVACEAESGFTPGAMEQTLGLSVDDVEAMGALASDRLEEDDLARGLFDNASLSIWLVDWTAPENRVRLFAGSVGDVSRGRTAFRAECRSLAHALGQERGRLYARLCDADLGDGRCKVDLASATYRGTGTVAAVTGDRSFLAAGLGGYAAGWFARGRLEWTSGANAGAAVEVRSHGAASGGASLELWERPALPIAAGDGFAVTAGCNKNLATCRDRFANVANFRGFPHMPGNDFVTSFAIRGEDNDGGRLA